MRKTIARRLSESKFSAPEFYLTMEINMDKAIEARKSMLEFSPVKISVNDIIIKAVAGSLRKNPAANASWLGDKIRYNHHIHIGVAVAIEDGLIVPVVKFADSKSLSHISAEVKELAEKAKNKKLQPNEFEGSKNKFSVYYQDKNPSNVSKSGGWRIAASFGDKLAAEKFANNSKNKQQYGEMYVDAYDSEYDLDESLSKCGCWEEATKHPMFKEAVLSEKAPPGMENWIKSNKDRFKHQYGDKKGVSALYATAWKMFYNKKK